MGHSASSPTRQEHQSRRSNNSPSDRTSNSKRRPSSDSEEEEDAGDDDLTISNKNQGSSSDLQEPSPPNLRSSRKRKANSGSSVDVASEPIAGTLRRSTRNSTASSSTQPATNTSQSDARSASSVSKRLRQVSGKGKKVFKRSGKQPSAEEVEDEEDLKASRRKQRRSIADQGVNSNGDAMQLDSDVETQPKPTSKGKGKAKAKAKNHQTSSDQAASTSAEPGGSASSTTAANTIPSSPFGSAGSALGSILARLSGAASSPTGPGRSPSAATSGPNQSSFASSSNGVPSVLPAALGALGALALGLPMLGSGGAPGEPPGPLQALLSDIMGTTSLAGMMGVRPAGAAGAASNVSGSTESATVPGSAPGVGAGSGEGVGSRAGSGSSDASAAGAAPTARSGGTSIIVQGALLARTLPSTPRNRSEVGVQASQGRAEASHSGTSDRAARCDRRTQPEEVSGGGETATATSLPSSTPSQQSESSPSPHEVEGESQGLPQAATIEDQASMLQRLLSVASAATALSLVTNDRQAAISERASQAASNHPSARDPASDVRNAVSEHLSGSRPIASNSRTREDRDSVALPTSRDTAAIASQVRGSLRNRLSASGDLASSSSTPASTSNNAAPTSSTSTTSPSGPTGDRTTFARNSSSHSNGETAQDSASSQASMPPIDQSASGAAQASQMGQILQDTLREGFGSRMNANRNSSSNSNGTGASGSSSNDRNANAAPQTQLESINETLAAARNGMMERGGSEGSFQNFMYDLVQDLGAAVRATSQDHSSELDEDADNDERTRLRREGDLSSGRLSFFRLFRFEPQSRGPSSNSTTPLIPALVVGVRSMGSSDGLFGAMSGANGSTASSTDRTTQDNYESNSTSRVNGDGVAVTEGQRRRVDNNSATTTTANSNSNAGDGDGSAELPASRFLLFICGGSYSETHPLLTSAHNVASRDVLTLIEILSIFNALGMVTATGGPAKPPTATEAELEAANFRVLEGKEIVQAASRGEIHESTAEKCLICWEEWRDDDKCRCLSCRHAFHETCVYQWLSKSSNTCPCCRHPAVQKEGQAAPQAQSSQSIF